MPEQTLKAPNEHFEICPENDDIDIHLPSGNVDIRLLLENDAVPSDRRVIVTLIRCDCEANTPPERGGTCSAANLRI
jgi:hypothetical protein